MAGKLSPSAAADADEQADAPAGGQSPAEVDTASLFRLVVERLRSISPAGVSNPRLVWDIPGNSTPGSLPLAVPDVPLGETAELILEVLRYSEGWLNGKEIAARLNPRDPPDYKSGGFRAAVDELKYRDLIETNQNKGYKAKR